MFQKLVTLAIIAGAAWWYYTGPYQDRTHPSDAQQLQQLQEDFAMCLRGKEYKAGATGVVEGDPEQICAEKLNVFKHEDGLWHSFDEVNR